MGAQDPGAQVLPSARQSPGSGFPKQRSCALAWQITSWRQLPAAWKQEPVVSKECQVPRVQDHAIALVSLFYFHSFNCFSQLFVL